MNLKPQDVLFLLKLVALGEKSWTFSQLALDLGMSPSEVHAAVQRTIAARLAVKGADGIRPIAQNLLEFLQHGIRYVFIPQRGPMTRGMPTAHAARPLAAQIVSGDGPPPVWPDPEGEVHGEAFSPLYRSVPFAAKQDPGLYELLALVDAIRGGRVRERDMAINEINNRLARDDTKHNEPVNAHDTLVIGGSLRISRDQLKKLAKRYHIRRLVLFGSAARGELEPDSDIDLLAEFEQGGSPSLGGMVNINDDFVDLFGGRKVDIATPTIMNNPYRRRSIERNMKELYVA